uniref:Uncharacterized protein n=1 Tax=Ciona savignyi TaxID=51511 RepID=H2Z5T5_CIOSA
MLYATGRDNRFFNLDRPDSDPAVEIIDPDTLVVPTLSSALVQSNS